MKQRNSRWYSTSSIFSQNSAFLLVFSLTNALVTENMFFFAQKHQKCDIILFIFARYRNYNGVVGTAFTVSLNFPKLHIYQTLLRAVKM